jgi:hypothetical protein
MEKPNVFTVEGAAATPSARPLEDHKSFPRQQHNVSQDELVNAGSLLASQMEALGYHPVMLFGMAASGKSTLLSSLLAVLRTEFELEAIAVEGDPILDPQSGYGRFIKSNSEHFFGRTVQDFIDGKPPTATKLALPFFVPVIFQPKDKPAVKLAFMESAGEWYRPDRKSDQFFPVLKKEIEDFIRHFQQGISFIHLAPYTQVAVKSLHVDKSADPKEINEASLALAGAMSAYQVIRTNKAADNHILLVTKWDAHVVQNASLPEILLDSVDAVGPFLKRNYEQAYTTFLGLSLKPQQISVANYCSGIMSGSEKQALKIDNENRPAVTSFPKELWRWLYANASGQSEGFRTDPFPSAEAVGGDYFHRFWKLVDKFFS